MNILMTRYPCYYFSTIVKYRTKGGKHAIFNRTEFRVGDLVESRGRIGVFIKVETHEFYEEVQNVMIQWSDGETIWWFNAWTLRKLEVDND